MTLENYHQELIAAVEANRLKWEEGFNAGYEKGKAECKAEWISVADAVPENQMVVLAYEPLAKAVYTFTYLSGEWWFGSVWMKSTLVSHWQPLPTPPQL